MHRLVQSRWLALAAMLLVAACRHEAYRWNSATDVWRVAHPVELDAQRDCAVAPELAGDSDWGGHVEVCREGDVTRFHVGYVEIDDQGFAWGETQLEQVLAELERHRARGAMVVVYVHGWEHDAARDDQNVRNFRRVLYRRALVEEARESGREVLGVVLGWRGRTRGTAMRGSFWARRKGAYRVGERDGGGALDEIDRKVASWRVEERSSGGERTSALVVGHSFGAAVIHAAWHNRLEAALAAGNPRTEPAGFDLLALVNPAFEAAAFERLHALGRRSNPGARPEVLVVQAKADCNTKCHLALAMSTMQGRGLLRRDRVDAFEKEEKLRRTSVGHFEWDGRYDARAIACAPRTGRSQGEPLEPFDPPSRSARIREREVVRVVEMCRARIKPHDDVCTFAPPRGDPRTPVTVLYDDAGKLMDYHSHVFSDSMWTLLWGWLDDATPPARLVRPTATPPTATPSTATAPPVPLDRPPINE